MKTLFWITAALVACVGLSSTTLAASRDASDPVSAGGSPAPPPTADEPAPASQPAEDADDHAKPAPPLRFLNLRYDEDFRYLDDHPELYETDPRMRLKNIHLDENWRLDVGGEFRFRMDARTNAIFGLERETQNTQQFYRYLLHANVRYRNLFRLFAQGIVADAEDQDGPFNPGQENHGDLQQLFADVRFLGESIPLTLRIGRQELAYGIYRLVGPLDWVATRRRFDTVKIFYESDQWNADVFYAKPVVVKRSPPDDWNEEYDFYGAYVTYKAIPRHTLDFYHFAVDRTEDTVNPNGRKGDQSIYTLGTRLSGKTGPVDYDTELSGQWGHWAGDTVQAWSWAFDGGYTFDKLPMTPRIATGFDWTSGDKDPNDRRVQTFNQLFPFDHVCNGFLDLIGRQNTTRTYVGLDVWPVRDKLKVSTVCHFYWLSEPADAQYEAGGQPLLRDRQGRYGVEVGQELDLWIEWTVTPYSSLMFGYAHFWDDHFVERTVPNGDDPDLFILQYRYRF